MSKVAVITDSVACLTKEQIEQYKIRILPITFAFEGKVYRDWIDVSPSQAYAFLGKAPHLFQSAPPTPGDYLEAYRDTSKGADSILCVTLSSKLSTMYNNAQMAAEMAKREIPQLLIEVLDSENCTAAEGFIALAAARAAADGKTFEEVIGIAKKVKEGVKFVCLLETIRHAYRTGRIPKIASQIGSRLPVKPILTTSKGLVHFAAVARTRGSGIEKMLEMMRDHVGSSEPVHVAVMHADCLEEAEKLKQRIATDFNCAELFITDFSPILGYATGKGTLAIAYYKSL